MPPPASTSITYPPGQGPGAGRHVVFLSGDEEYRERGGSADAGEDPEPASRFRTTVLFSVDADGTIDPKAVTSLSNPEALEQRRPDRHAAPFPAPARCRTWRDSTIDFAPASRSSRCGRARMRSTDFPKGSPWESLELRQRRRIRKRVLGETWLTHWGKHKVEATRGAIEPAQRDHPLLRGIYQPLRRHRRLRSVSARRRDGPRRAAWCSKA